MRILLVGGSKSGKSMLAQRLIKSLADGAPMYYWAAMEPVDAEDGARVLRHREEREGWGFITVERGRELSAQPLLPEAAVLFDSATALLANEMFGALGFDSASVERAEEELLRLSETVRHFVCVCDDIQRDGMKYEALTEEYRRGLAHICRGLANEFDCVCEVSCGVPRVIKGELPRTE